MRDAMIDALQGELSEDDMFQEMLQEKEDYFHLTHNPVHEFYGSSLDDDDYTDCYNEAVHINEY
jgi:hypothetical protein